jgi:hypothetical protein
MTDFVLAEAAAVVVQRHVVSPIPRTLRTRSVNQRVPKR